MSSERTNINVKLRSYNSVLLDKATALFIKSVENVGGRVSGPIPFPKKTKVSTVVRSPHVDKKSMDRFILSTYTRLVRIIDVNPKLIDELTKIEIQSGVGVEIYITNN